MTISHQNISFVIPCKNESKSIASLVDSLIREYKSSEIIVVDDGSSDETSLILSDKPGITVIKHKYSKGNGAAIKSGASLASRDVLITMDADGQHRVEDIHNLIDELSQGYDMVIGARRNSSQANNIRLLGNTIYNKLATYITGHNISDLTSGMRAVKRCKFMEFITLLPNGFSYPTTITMAFFRSGYSIKYVDIKTNSRIGESHVSIFKDGIRFLLIIFKVGTLYSPLKIFAPISLFFFSTGISYYLYTYFKASEFTNMGLLLLITSVFIFIFGLISEQITTLTYLNKKGR